MGADLFRAWRGLASQVDYFVKETRVLPVTSYACRGHKTACQFSHRAIRSEDLSAMSAVLTRKAVPIVVLVLMGLSGEWFRILLIASIISGTM